ncbi:MAG: LysM peptidoglycan-binding domain-containing protein [Burkholderiales bacterium]|nr:LysM peptidoglycan-binding domain-containing protein [Burkholderiales bacterium]
MRRIISVVPFIFGLVIPSTSAWAEETAQAAREAPGAGVEQGTAHSAAAAVEPLLQNPVPDRYVVKRGDTLWDISARFLRNPWRWPEVWGINKDAIGNPHLIYPGDVVILDLTGATPRLRLEGADDGGVSRWSQGEPQLSRLSPQMRSNELAKMPIPTISAKLIEPFLARTLVVDASQVASAPTIVAATDSRVAVSAGDTAYVTGLTDVQQPRWQVYRQGRVFQDPDTKEVLGFEAVYLGDADLMGSGNVSTLHIARAAQEIAVGDKLAIAPPQTSAPFVPHAPDQEVKGRVIAGSDNSVFEMAPYSTIIINQGARNGLQSGHVLGLYHSEGSIPNGRNKPIPLPEQRYGLVLVFRVFDKMAYGLVMSATRPVHVLDTVRNP